MTESGNKLRSSRLTQPDSKAIEPFHQAESLSRCELYWLPASLPAKTKERTWTLLFLGELVRRLAAAEGLQAELFLESDAVYPDRRDDFIQTALDFNPVMGFSRKPDSILPSMPDENYIDAIRRQEKPFNLKDFLQGTCYWFLRNQLQKQMDLFWGFGGMTLLLVKPDPAAKAPGVVIPRGVTKHPAYQGLSQQADIASMLNAAFRTQSGFLKKSKERFGKGWEHRLEYKGVLFILPRWSTQDFFQLPEEEIGHLFEVCEVYISESPADKGVIVASAKPIQSQIQEAVGALRQAGEIFA